MDFWEARNPAFWTQIPSSPESAGGSCFSNLTSSFSCWLRILPEEAGATKTDEFLLDPSYLIYFILLQFIWNDARCKWDVFFQPRKRKCREDSATSTHRWVGFFNICPTFKGQTSWSRRMIVWESLAPQTQNKTSQALKCPKVCFPRFGTKKMPKRERKVEMCVKIDVSSYFNMGASKNSGTPKWMVVMENPIKIDDLGGKPTIFGNIHMFQCYFLHVLSRGQILPCNTHPPQASPSLGGGSQDVARNMWRAGRTDLIKIFGCFLKWWVFPPNHPMFNRVFHYKPSILGETPLFLETPISVPNVWMVNSQLNVYQGVPNW